MNMEIAQLKENSAAALAAADGIYEAAKEDGRQLTAEEQGKFDAYMTEHGRLGEDITRRETLEAAKENATKSQRKSEAQEPMETAQISMPNVEVWTNRTSRNFTGPQARDNAFLSGMWLRANLWNDARAKTWCREHGVDHAIQQRAMSTGVLGLGGALVPDEFEQTVVDLRDKFGVIRAHCRDYPMSSDHMIIPRCTDGLTAYPIGDNASVTASDKTWDNLGLTAKKWAVLARYSSELAEDSVISVADDLAEDIAMAFAEKEDDCAINGDGTHASYHGVYGFLTDLETNRATLAGSVPAFTAHDTWPEIDATDVASLMGILPGRHHPGAKFFCSRLAYAAVFMRLAQTAGGSAIRDIERGANKVPYYMGYPVIISDKFPIGTLITDYTDEIIIVFGDLAKGVAFGTRRGLTVKVDSSRYLDQDQIAVLGTTRWDINCHGTGSATVPGPICGLYGGT